MMVMTGPFSFFSDGLPDSFRVPLLQMFLLGGCSVFHSHSTFVAFSFFFSLPAFFTFTRLAAPGTILLFRLPLFLIRFFSS